MSSYQTIADFYKVPIFGVRIISHEDITYIIMNSYRKLAYFYKMSILVYNELLSKHNRFLYYVHFYV